MKNAVLPKIVWPQGGTVLKAFTGCDLWSGGAGDASFRVPYKFCNNKHKYQQLIFFYHVQIIAEILDFPVVLTK